MNWSYCICLCTEHNFQVGKLFKSHWGLSSSFYFSTTDLLEILGDILTGLFNTGTNEEQLWILLADSEYIPISPLPRPVWVGSPEKQAGPQDPEFV